MLRHMVVFFQVLILSCILVLRPVEAQELSEQIISDLVTVGISGAATLSGNIPLAMASGVLSKYISTYGIQGVKALINKVKGAPPQDLGEINIYYVYLIHVKRNLYQSMINIRSNVKADQTNQTIISEIEELEASLRGNCSEGDCTVSGIDESLVNYQFLNLALDAKQSFDISSYIESQQIKSTYQYLMLLYMDVVLVEQKLLEGQYNVLANQVSELLETLEDNVYLSNEEKEYSFQMSLNLVLKWQKHRDQRRAILLSALKRPMEEMQNENSDLQDEINGYQDANDDLKKIMAGL